MNTANFYLLAKHIHDETRTFKDRTEDENSTDAAVDILDVVMMLLSFLCYIALAISYLKPKYMAKITWLTTVYISMRLSFWLMLAYI